MPRSLVLLLALTTLPTAVLAQSVDAAGPFSTSNDNLAQAAPIVRAYADGNGGGYADPNAQGSPVNSGPAGSASANGPQMTGPPANGPMPSGRRIISSQPIPGVWLRVDGNSAVTTVSADAKGTELRVEHGVANVSVHHPGENSRILVDLPGGHTALLKDGLYTFNAETNTVRVLKGEAFAYPGAAVSGVKVKEEHQFAFAPAGAKNNRSVEVARYELMSDYLPGEGDGSPRPGYGYGPYGDGFYGYPPLAYGFGYPYGYYPYGYGLGLGFGYYGGFGGFRGGFRGGRF